MRGLRFSKTDGALVVIALSLVGAWLAFPPPISHDRSSLGNWGDLAADPPQSLLLVRGASRIELSQSKGASGERHWSVTGLSFAQLDPAVLDRLLHALSHLELARTIDTKPEGAGLEQPTFRLELVTRSEVRKIALGNQTPSPKGGRYVAIARGNEQLFGVVTAATANGIEIEPDSLLELRAVDLLPSEIDRIELSLGGSVIGLERQRGGSWTLPKPDATRVDRKEVSRLLLAVTELRLTKLLNPGSILRHASPEDIGVTLRSKRDSRPMTHLMRIGGSCPTAADQLLITIEGERKLAGCVDNGVLARLRLDPSTLPDQSVFSLHGDEVDRLDVSGDLASWSLEREGAAFRLKQGKVRSITLRTGNAFLIAATSVRGRISGRCDFAALRSGELMSMRSFAVGDDGPTIESIRFGQVLDDGSQVLCRDDNSELTISLDAARQLDTDPAGLRDPQLLDVPVSSVKEIRIVQGKARRLLRWNNRGLLELVEPRGAQIDAAAVETLRERLSQLHVRRWFPSRISNGLKPQLSDILLEFLVTADPSVQDAGESAQDLVQTQRHQLRLGLEGPNDGVGWFDLEPTPFQVDPVLADIITNIVPARVK